jgi:hypothetical protein
MELQKRALAITDSAWDVICEMLKPGLDQLPDATADLKHRPDYGKSRITVHCREKEDSEIQTLVLVVDFLHDCREVQIPNIMMPNAMKHQRLGKRLIKALFNTAHANSYQLLVVDLVPSFFDRLVKRGAQPVDHETVLITADTDLEGDVGSLRHPAEQDPESVRTISILDLIPPAPSHD